MDYLRFTRKAPENKHHNRCEVMPWWDKFVGAVRKCPQLYLDGGRYSMLEVITFLERQAASSLKLWLQANNGDMEDIVDIVDMINGAKLNHRQEQLLSRIRQAQAEWRQDIVSIGGRRC